MEIYECSVDYISELGGMARSIHRLYQEEYWDFRHL
jgi:hypothetical protein